MTAAVAVPVSVTEAVAASLPRASEAVKVPAAVEVNVTETVQLLPTASVVPQVVVWVKALAFVPPIETPLRLTTAVPVFVNVTVWEALAALMDAVKVSEVTERLTVFWAAGVVAAVTDMLPLQPPRPSRTAKANTEKIQSSERWRGAGVTKAGSRSKRSSQRRVCLAFGCGRTEIQGETISRPQRNVPDAV